MLDESAFPNTGDSHVRSNSEVVDPWLVWVLVRLEVITVLSWQLRVLVVGVLRVHHFNEENWISLAWNSSKSDCKVRLHVSDDVSIILIISLVRETDLVHTKFEKLEPISVKPTVGWRLGECEHVEDVFSFGHEVVEGKVWSQSDVVITGKMVVWITSIDHNSIVDVMLGRKEVLGVLIPL